MKTKGVDVEDGLRDDVEDAVQKVGNATGCTVSALPCSCASQLDAQVLPCQSCPARAQGTGELLTHFPCLVGFIFSEKICLY